MSTSRYRIVVDGELDAASARLFDDLRIERLQRRTVLETDDVDQAALNGVLDRLRAIGAVLVRLDRLSNAGEVTQD